MAKVFVFLEGNAQDLKKGSIELLTAAKQSGREVVAGLVGGLWICRQSVAGATRAEIGVAGGLKIWQNIKDEEQREV